MKEKDLRISLLGSAKTRHEAFSSIVKEFSPILYRQIRRMVTWHDDANDVLQNTFLKAWKSIDSFRGDAEISTWLYRIAYNESITFLAKRNSAPLLSDTDASELRTLESDPYFDGDALQLQLEKAIITLPDKQRAVFQLKYFEEKKYEEISQILGTSVGALKASYHLAVKKIEAYFENED